MKNYTLIAFLSEGIGQKNCWNEWTPGPAEQHIFYSNNTEEISQEWGKLMHINKDYELTLLFNGSDITDEDYDEYLRIENEAIKIKNVLDKEKEIQNKKILQELKEKEEAQIIKNKYLEEEREKAELLRLQAKYSPNKEQP